MSEFPVPDQPSFSELWDEYIARKSDSSDDPCSALYALPMPLISAIVDEVPNFFEAEAYTFECRLARLLARFHAIGFNRARLIFCPLFQSQSMAAITKEQFDDLGWAAAGVEFDKLKSPLQKADSSAETFRHQLTAFIGWLITNSTFVGEVAQYRAVVSDCSFQNSSDDEGVAHELQTRLREFCARWQIDGFYCWDLPRPPFVNLGGPELPKSMQSCAESVTLQIPSVVRLPSRFAVEKLVKQTAECLTGAHLAEWQRIVSRSVGDLGVRRFGDILRLHFFRNIALASRYSARFSGNVEALDRAFARFLDDRSTDSVKGLRLTIERRLKHI